ncbi:MAG: hypothetical protein IKR69_02535 [Bacteroidales bacterium]|nr:hypothetical protein [Bacteroidales bacterium]
MTKRIFGAIFFAVLSLAACSKTDDNDKGTNATVPTPVAVDLGLSVKWASFNLGASAPEEYGDYYAWGEIKTKNSYSFLTYKFGTESTGPLSKYNSASILDLEDDAAHILLGGNWRMPTISEWEELRSNCEWSLNESRNGYKVTGGNGNSIFLPLAGFRSETYLLKAGEAGLYWSSTSFERATKDEPWNAWFEHLYPDDDIYAIMEDYAMRCYGMTIRPVIK